MIQYEMFDTTYLLNFGKIWIRKKKKKTIKRVMNKVIQYPEI